MIYKAISLWQPWAQLVIDGRKKIETRSWPAPRWLVGRSLAIHATKKIIQEAADEWGYANCPRGAIVGIVRLDGTEQFDAGYHLRISQEEFDYGDYTPGRWGWHVTVLEKFLVPYPTKGFQGIFSWTRRDAG